MMAVYIVVKKMAQVPVLVLSHSGPQMVSGHTEQRVLLALPRAFVGKEPK